MVCKVGTESDSGWGYCRIPRLGETLPALHRFHYRGRPAQVGWSSLILSKALIPPGVVMTAGGHREGLALHPGVLPLTSLVLVAPMLREWKTSCQQLCGLGDSPSGYIALSPDGARERLQQARTRGREGEGHVWKPVLLLTWLCNPGQVIVLSL